MSYLVSKESEFEKIKAKNQLSSSKYKNQFIIPNAIEELKLSDIVNSVV